MLSCYDNVFENKILTLRKDSKMKVEMRLGMKRFIAKILKFLRFKPKCSTGIHGLKTSGYGKLDQFGFWQFPLSDGEVW